MHKPICNSWTIRGFVYTHQLVNFNMNFWVANILAIDCKHYTKLCTSFIPAHITYLYKISSKNTRILTSWVRVWWISFLKNHTSQKTNIGLFLCDYINSGFLRCMYDKYANEWYILWCRCHYELLNFATAKLILTPASPRNPLRQSRFFLCFFFGGGGGGGGVAEVKTLSISVTFDIFQSNVSWNRL
jgi:hypothetical protein